ncbi:unnamed protein product [Linum trigynum]|uniref:threonine ammonia-lyase n=1 Tax=Linum trigynum TaxID=586398 RepID=A0AAV2D4B0_9ROSI
MLHGFLSRVKPRSLSSTTTGAAAAHKPQLKIIAQSAANNPEISTVMMAPVLFPPPLMKVAAGSLQYESGLLGPVPEKQKNAAAGGDGGGGGVHNVNEMSYLTRILSSKVYDVAIESPLDSAPKLSERLGVGVWLKREDLQPKRLISNFKYHGQRIVLDQVGGFADGVAVKAVGEEPFRLCKELVDGVVLVSRDAICASIKDMFEENRSILEPAGALAMAGAEAYCKYYGLKGESVVAITSGANMNFDRLGLVSQLADVGRRSEAVLATFVPEKWGNFIQFYKLVGPVNISEFRYRYDAHKEQALVLYSVSFDTTMELEKLQDWMKSANLYTLNLTDNDLVKDHLQFLVGGRSKIENEIVCQFIFPKRPGALGKFLDLFSVSWNITLFHYRDQGGSDANVLVGFQVAASEMDEFKSLANSLHCDYKFETDSEVLELLLH